MTDDIGYEAARTELAEVVRKLETGDQPLEESLALWQRGESGRPGASVPCLPPNV